jgi:hypothetical protein
MELTPERALKEELEVNRHVDGLLPDVLGLADEIARGLGREAAGATPWLESLLMAAGRSSAPRELRLFAEYRMALAEPRPARAAAERLLVGLDELEGWLTKRLGVSGERVPGVVRRRCRQLLFGYLLRYCNVAAVHPVRQENAPKEGPERRPPGPERAPAGPRRREDSRPREQQQPAGNAEEASGGEDGPHRRRRRRGRGRGHGPEDRPATGPASGTPPSQPAQASGNDPAPRVREGTAPEPPPAQALPEKEGQG